MRLLISVLVFILGAQICFAQETAQPEAKQAKQLAGFDWLKQFEGDWTTEFNGTMNCRTVGRQWIVNEISFQNRLSSVQTIGYDPKKKQFIGTWIDESSGFMWRYASGSLDATGKTLVFEAEGPSMGDPTNMVLYRDTYEFKNENELAVTSQALDDKKEWKTFNVSKMMRMTE